MSEVRLLFKQKDFEYEAGKRRLRFAPTNTNPLKRDKTKRRQIAPQQQASFKPAANNPLSKINVPAQKPLIPSQQSNPTSTSSITFVKTTTTTTSTVNTANTANTQQVRKVLIFNDKGPWSAIRGHFIKVYDTKKERSDIYVANPFGSMGLRKQQEIKERFDIKNKDSEIKNESVNKQISIKTYLTILEDMKKDLRTKWDDQDKVGTLQIAIQATKLLHDTEKAKFHALKFAYVIDIVEQFGIYVFERIKSLSFPNMSQQKVREMTIHQLSGNNIAESAQEICRNWLLKIGSIRELIPRAIVETTLLRLYFFLENGKKAKQVLYRLAKTNRGFGEYINCIFFSTFLIRIGHEVLPKEKGYILDILEDVFFYIKQGKTKFNRPDITYDEFFDILDPFFKSAFDSLGENLEETDFRRLTKSLPQNPHHIIIKNLINSFNQGLLVYYSCDIAQMLQKINKQQKYPILKLLMEKIASSKFNQGREFTFLLWIDLNEIDDVKIFLDLLAPFMEIIFRNIQGTDKSHFINLILEKFNYMFTNFRNPKQKDFFVKFEEFLSTLLQNTEEISEILSIQPFLQIITYFPKAIKADICKKISSKFIDREESVINDPVVVNTVLTLMKNLDGQGNIEKLVIDFVKKVDFKSDLEGMLNFYGQIRASFGHIHQVTFDLINRSIGLTHKARRLSKGRITKKIVSFLQACIAYCYITIPLIDSPIIKIRLYLYLSEVALANNLISQSTSSLKMSISQLLELQDSKKRDDHVYQILKKIIGFMIVVPDDPESQYLFLFNGLLNAFEMIKFKQGTQAIYRLKFYGDCLVYLNSQVQERLPFHIQGVDSNDFLFKTKDFRKAVVQKLMEVFFKLEEALTEIEKQPVSDIQIEKLNLATFIECVLNILNNLQYTTRTEKFLKRLCAAIEKTGDKISRDKVNKNFFLQKLKCLEYMNREFGEQEYPELLINLTKYIS